MQRFTPRKPKSIWSHLNKGHVARLTKASGIDAEAGRKRKVAELMGMLVRGEAILQWPLSAAAKKQSRLARGDP